MLGVHFISTTTLLTNLNKAFRNGSLFYLYLCVMTRVIKICDRYYPQYLEVVNFLPKLFSRWRHFKYYCEGDFDRIGVITGDSYKDISFSTKEEANNYIINQ